MTTKTQEVITEPATLPATEAAAPVIQEVQEVVVETTPTAAAAPILETKLATSKLIDSKQAFTTVKSTAPAPPPPAAAPASSTFAFVSPDSFQPGTFSPFRETIQQKI